MAKGARVDHELLSMALVGYLSQKAKIEAAIAEIRAKLGNGGTAVPSAAASASTVSPSGDRRKMSAAARRRIAAAQKKRWAQIPSGARPNCEAKAQNERLPLAGRQSAMLLADAGTRYERRNRDRRQTPDPFAFAPDRIFHRPKDRSRTLS